MIDILLFNVIRYEIKKKKKLINERKINYKECET